ncbi:MAG: hypothetical protein A3G34_08525 [Candidatus Lindowbacteria bacterium RIFCSPLOWO2_12_FULL_62_27]|nr:MAG: hypothetical protein A3G34_08525 [Candidatus Lindowbacteria bacterium RIFCSPLOWO2_12_FULL_62_27]
MSVSNATRADRLIPVRAVMIAFLALALSPSPASAFAPAVVSVIHNFSLGADYEDPSLVYLDTSVWELLVYESSTSMVYILSPSGRLKYYFKVDVADPAVLFAAPNGDIGLVSRAGELSLYDYRGNFIEKKHLRNGSGTAVTGGHYSPDRKAVFFADYHSQAAYGVTLNGDVVFMKEGFRRISDCVYQGGKVYVADQGGYSVMIYDADQGVLIHRFGRAGGKPGTFSLINRVYVSADGNVWVSDVGKRTLEVFNPTGEFETELFLPGFRSAAFVNNIMYVSSNVLKAVTVYRIK